MARLWTCPSCGQNEQNENNDKVALVINGGLLIDDREFASCKCKHCGAYFVVDVASTKNKDDVL